MCIFSITVDTRPTIKALQHAKIINDITPKWFELGIALLDDSQVTQLRTIKSNNNEVTRCCIEMLMYWLETHPSATWNNLREALMTPGVEMNNVATKIEYAG